MSVDAKDLSGSAGGESFMDRVLADQLRIIDDKLRSHPRAWGRNVVTVRLPFTGLNVPGMARDDAQRLLYSLLIRSLEKRGFEVGIHITSADVHLYVAWELELDKEEVAAINALIKSRRVYSAPAPPESLTVAEFVEKGRLPRSSEAAVRVGAAPPAAPLRAGDGGAMAPRGGVERPERAGEGEAALVTGADLSLGGVAPDAAADAK